MATQKPTPVTHIFKEVNIGKYKTTNHYELVEVKNGSSKLSNKLNISANRNCALSMPEYWLKLHEGNKWAKKWLTGLFKTPNVNIFYGDTKHKTNLLLFEFSNDKRFLKVYFYPNYYTSNFTNIKK